MSLPEIRTKPWCISPELHPINNASCLALNQHRLRCSLLRSHSKESWDMKIRPTRMLVCCLAFAGMLVPSIGQAQMMVEMPLVTCAQYLAMPPEQSAVFAAWMSGWYNQKMGNTYINLQAQART